IELGVAKQVLPGRNVEGGARTGDQKRAQSKTFGQTNRATHEEALAIVKRGAAVVERRIVRIAWCVCWAGSVAICVVEDVVAEDGQLGAHADAAVEDELVLLEEACGLILVENLARRRLPRPVRVDEVGVEGMDASGVQ